jgi:hypothetical protein
MLRRQETPERPVWFRAFPVLVGIFPGSSALFRVYSGFIPGCSEIIFVGLQRVE